MDRPAERITLQSASAKDLPSGKSARKSALPAGLQPGALAELQSAAATFDYLRSTGDPVEFWEALRLARSRRGLPAVEGCAVQAPDADADAALRKELDALRERFVELVGELRDFLKDTPGLPQPEERFELSLAFLMASSREHEAVAQWIREPDKHRGKAAEKLRGLATITDPYREALKPWSLGASTA